MKSSANLQTVRELYDAFGRGDTERVRRLFAPDIEWNQMDGFPRGGRHVGPDAVFEKVFKGFRDDWSEWRAEVDDFADAGERIIAFGRYVGRFKATGRACRAEFAHVYIVRGGCIVRFDQYADTRRVAEAMGLA